MNDNTIYLHSLEYAIAHDESSAYHASYQRNRECAAAIDKAITASCHNYYYYDLPFALNAVTKEFGLERVIWVTAAVVQHFAHDGRLSRANKDWARNFPIPDEKGAGFLPQTHLTVLNGFVDKVRAEHSYEMVQTVGAYEKSHHMAERNRMTWFYSDMGSFVPNSGVTEQQLMERCVEIAEKQSVRAQLRAARKSEKIVPAPKKKHHKAER